MGRCRMGLTYYHLIRKPIIAPLGVIGTGTESGFVSKISSLISSGDRYPPYFFFSIFNGIANSTELSFNPPILIGNGSKVVERDENVVPQPTHANNRTIIKRLTYIKYIKPTMTENLI